MSAGDTVNPVVIATSTLDETVALIGAQSGESLDARIERLETAARLLAEALKALPLPTGGDYAPASLVGNVTELFTHIFGPAHPLSK
jgi:hypothetical protein